jgi:hypothetical protein
MVTSSVMERLSSEVLGQLQLFALFKLVSAKPVGTPLRALSLGHSPESQ